MPDLDRQSLAQEIADEFTLNATQQRAFMIITEHTTDSQSPPLHMFIGGPGGTGKSRVIHAIKQFFI